MVCYFSPRYGGEGDSVGSVGIYFNPIIWAPFLKSSDFRFSKIIRINSVDEGTEKATLRNTIELEGEG